MILLVIFAIFLLLTIFRLINTIKRILKGYVQYDYKAENLFFNILLIIYFSLSFLYALFNLYCWNFKIMRLFGDMKIVIYLCSILTIAYIFSKIMENFSKKLEISYFRCYKCFIFISLFILFISYGIIEPYFLFGTFDKESSFKQIIIDLPEIIAFVFCCFSFLIILTKFYSLGKKYILFNSSFQDEVNRSLICGFIIGGSIFLKAIYYATFPFVMDFKWFLINKKAEPNSYFEIIVCSYIIITEIIPVLGGMILIPSINPHHKSKNSGKLEYILNKSIFK